MSWLHLVVAGTAGLAAMRAAIDRGDLDEAARQGSIAGPAVVEAALDAPDRPTRLAGIAAAPSATPQIAGRAELLDALARTAEGPDRRTAIPAARAARSIARAVFDDRPGELPDDLAAADIAAWRAAWVHLAERADRWIELRVLALDTAAALDPEGIGVDLAAALADRDPAYRRAAVAVVPMPVPPAMRAPLATAVARDTSDDVALDAARALCADLAIDPPGPVLDALGPAGVERIRSLVRRPGTSALARRQTARCLARR